MKSHPLFTVLAVCSIATAVADTYTVTNTNPSGPGSLFQAISDADAHPNSIGVPDTIAFDVPFTDPNRDPATGVFTITPGLFGLMFINDAVVIDGYTQGSSTATTTDDAKPNSLAMGDNAVLP